MQELVVIYRKNTDVIKLDKKKFMTSTALVSTLSFIIDRKIYDIYLMLLDWRNKYKSVYDRLKINRIKVGYDYINIGGVKWFMDNPHINGIIYYFYVFFGDELGTPINIEWITSINSMPGKDYDERFENLVKILSLLKGISLRSL